MEICWTYINEDAFVLGHLAKLLKSFGKTPGMIQKC